MRSKARPQKRPSSILAVVRRYALCLACAVPLLHRIYVTFTVHSSQRLLQHQNPLTVLSSLASFSTSKDRQRSRGAVVESDRALEGSAGSNSTTMDNRHLPCAVNRSDPLLHSVQVPSFIIAGTQKGGTTALFMMLRQHPNLVSTRHMEAHFFDRIPAVWNGTFSTTTDATSVAEEQKCQHQKKYFEMFDAQKLRDRILRLQSTLESPIDTLYTFEKTPNYLCISRVPEYIHRITPWAKVLIVLRNPIDRAYSHFRMLQVQAAAHRHRHGGGNNRRGGHYNRTFVVDKLVPKTFDEMIAEESHHLRSLNLTLAPGLALYKYAHRDEGSTEELVQRFCRLRNQTCSFTPPTLNDRLQHFKSIFDDAKERRRVQCSGLSRGLYAQQLAPWLRYFVLDETLLVVRYEQFLEDRLSVLTTVLNFLGAPPFPSDLLPQNDSSYTKSERLSFLGRSYSPYNTHRVDHEPLRNATREYLQRFYKPYNDELADLLGEEWRDVWG
jgi:Sulfotransferase family